MIEYRNLRRTGVRVSSLGLGTMNFGGRANPDRDECVRITLEAIDRGINLIDTSDSYNAGQSEEIVGAALAEGRRSDVILATKFNRPGGSGINEQGNSRRWIFQAVERSLKRLRTDWIDLYQVHRPEPDTDLDETLGALTDLVRQGKIRYFGTSTFAPSTLVEAQWVAERRGRERPVSEQPPYSILVRDIEREVLPVAQRHGLAVISWSPLAGGWLSGGYHEEGHRPAAWRLDRLPRKYDVRHPENAGKLRALLALQALADEAGLSLLHMAIAFVIRHPAITSALIGPRTLSHLDSHLESAKITLSDEVLDRIDAIVPPGANFGTHDLGHIPPALLDPQLRRRRG